MKKFIYKFTKWKPNQLKITRTRKESNIWLRYHCLDVKGNVLSIGSGDDNDKEGGKYRDYFKNGSSYTTSEISHDHKCDKVLDVRNLSEITEAAYDCVFCSGVLEHVDDYLKGLHEITRILKSGGILLIGLPFRQAVHMRGQDFWRFTEYGIRHLLKRDYKIIDLAPMDNSVLDFPAAYWVKAQKL
ncbi:MAG: methyltransferase domain-containing protein [Candidatus Omnitrophica bacterium]|nr:methyltransferase domain-containing protein [Candidatus Omnitrophota bacterium]